MQEEKQQKVEQEEEKQKEKNQEKKERCLHHNPYPGWNVVFENQKK